MVSLSEHKRSPVPTVIVEGACVPGVRMVPFGSLWLRAVCAHTGLVCFPVGRFLYDITEGRGEEDSVRGWADDPVHDIRGQKQAVWYGKKYHHERQAGGV